MKPNNPIDAQLNECTWIKSSLPNAVELLKNTKAGLIYTNEDAFGLVSNKVKVVDDPKKAILDE